METDNITFHQDDLIATSFAVFDEMRKNEELCDLKITVGNHSFAAHRVVLAAGIPYFRSVFTGKGTEESEKEVTIDLDAKAFEALIHFAYTSRVHITVENALSLLVASQFLQLTRVKDACVEFISKKISVANVVEVRSLAVDFNILKLMECSETYIAQNFEEFSKSQSFLSLRGRCLKEIIAKDDLNAPSEEMVYEAVIRWVKHSPSERKVILPELLTEVGMVFLPIEYLITRVASEELIKCSEPCKELLDKIKNYHLLPKQHQEPLTLKTQARGENLRREISRRKERKFNDATERIYALCYSRTTGYSVSCCDLQKKVWNTLSSWKAGSGNIWAVAVANENLYVFDSKITKFNLRTLMWEIVDHNPPNIEYGAVLTHGNTIYCFESYVWDFDTKTNRWVENRKINVSHGMVPAAASLGEFIYVTGGCRNFQGLRSADKYSPSSGEWTAISPMHCPRWNHSSASLNGKIYVCCGRNSQEIYLRTVEVYDPVANQWEPISILKRGRRSFSLISHNCKLYALGGGIDSGGYTREIEIFDPENYHWTAGFSAPEGIRRAVLAPANIN